MPSRLHDFTHLQVHSHFTLLGGTVPVDELAARAAAEGMTHLALTDTNALYGAVAFDRACRKAGVSPIVGMTVTVTPPGERFEPILAEKAQAPKAVERIGPILAEKAQAPKAVERIGPILAEKAQAPWAMERIGPILAETAQAPWAMERIGSATSPGRLVLLATGPAGYRSLCRLSSCIQADPQREALAAQGLSWDDLEAHREGLVCLSGGRMGWVERLLRAGEADAAARYAARLADLYGQDGYLSLEIHSPEDWPVVEEMATLGQRFGLRPVAAQPVFCLSPDEVPRLRLLAAIDHNIPLEAVPPSALPANGDPRVELHWLSPGEVAQRFAGLPEALVNVGEIAARCGPALPGGEPIWPDLNLPQGQSPDEALAALARSGLEGHYGPEPSPAVRQRLDAELSAIARHGYAPIFLVVADIARFARKAGVPINTRGSVANSLVAYCSGITHVDPIAHDLLFERFLNPARADLPDIDLDFCSRQRDRVLDYVRRTYGADRVALVSTVSTLQPRGAVRETAKAYGVDEAEVGRLVARLPRRWHPDPRRRDKRTVEDVLAELADPRQREVVRAAYSIVGQPHHLSVHPGGVVITPGPLTSVVPLQWAPKGFLITQFDHHDVEALGLPKLDLLGIRALTVLADAERLVRRHHDPDFHLADIPFDDAGSGDLLSRGETIGVFQCESAGAQRTLRQLRARSVRDLAVANAFFKPGPATGGMARAFVRRYRGEEPVRFLHPALAPILGTTQGILLFQEQVLRVAREIAGLSWAQADQLRRGMGHFGHDQMAEMEAAFVSGCQQQPPEGPGFNQQQADRLWEQVLAFAGYGFNQGHATSYAMVSFRSAYLKSRWPAAFLCARLAEWGGYHHRAVYMAEAARLGLNVRPPHVNHSGRRFALGWEGEQGVLWMGLGQVRDLRRASIGAIVAEQAQQPFASLRDLLQRVPLQDKEVTHLVQCGALDGLGESRAALLAETSEIRQAGSALQMTLGFAGPEVEAEPAAQRLAWERHLLGQPVSVHPLEVVAEHLPSSLPLRRLPEQPGQRVTVAGVRLPGWTGGQGFFLSDGDAFVTARGDAGRGAPPPWQPLVARGRWMSNEWGTAWFQVEEMEEV